MKQLGNLAIACARRNDTIMLIKKGEVTVVVSHVDGGIGTKTFETQWEDDQRIEEICHELNFGSLARGDAQ